MWLGWAVANEGDWASAQPLFAESVRRSRELGDEHQSLLASTLLARTHAELGDRGRARTIDEDNLRRAGELGNEFFHRQRFSSSTCILLQNVPFRISGNASSPKARP